MASSSNPTAPLLLVNYCDTGKPLGTSKLTLQQLDSDTLQYFQKQTRRLSGDLELPLEDHLPGDFGFLEYRIGSDLNGAYTLYYYHDEVILASLFLRGRDSEAETELMQVFKYLLLDDQDEDDPTEEQLDSILSSTRFDFEKTTERPVAFAVAFQREGVEPEVYRHVAAMNQHLAFAFCC